MGWGGGGGSKMKQGGGGGVGWGGGGGSKMKHTGDASSEVASIFKAVLIIHQQATNDDGVNLVQVVVWINNAGFSHTIQLEPSH